MNLLKLAQSQGVIRLQCKCTIQPSTCTRSNSTTSTPYLKDPS